MSLQKVEDYDKIFKTLCTLHNSLIKSDDLDTNWMGYCESFMEDHQRRNTYPLMLLRLHS